MVAKSGEYGSERICVYINNKKLKYCIYANSDVGVAITMNPLSGEYKRLLGNITFKYIHKLIIKKFQGIRLM